MTEEDGRIISGEKLMILDLLIKMTPEQMEILEMIMQLSEENQRKMKGVARLLASMERMEDAFRTIMDTVGTAAKTIEKWLEEMAWEKETEPQQLPQPEAGNRTGMRAVRAVRRYYYLKILYGQGVDYGGPGLPRLMLDRITDDGLRRAETGNGQERRTTKMRIFTNILLGSTAALLMLGVIGEQEKEKQQNLTLAFTATISTIALLNAFAW